MFLILMNITLSIMFMFMNHPLSLGLILLLQTALISFISGQFCLNFWFSYILFLIMIGGMLILFIYMTSIASNEKFSINISTIIATVVSSIITATFIMWKTFPYDLSIKNEMINYQETLSFSMAKFITFPLGLILMFMITYLFIALIAIVKIIDNKQGPLRPKN